MRSSFFQPILLLLILALFSKASVLFGRIQQQTTSVQDTKSSVMLIDTAYAGGHGKEEKKENNFDKYGTIRSQEEQEKFVEKNEEAKIEPLVAQGGEEFTRAELDLLKELAKRRERLAQDEKDIEVRKAVLKATESRIDQKVAELKSLQIKLQELMKEYNKKENSKIMSLVKIYETMKPKDAAKIFNELEMEVLLRVVGNMKEVKLAPIIATMNPEKAREISMELAKQKTLE